MTSEGSCEKILKLIIHDLDSRYDGMIGRFLGRDCPASGFSIGFERIITILSDCFSYSLIGTI